MTRIPVLRVAGSHREVGRAVGSATAPALRDAVAFGAALPAGRSRAEQLALAARYRDATRADTPWLVEEIDGAAEGAGTGPGPGTPGPGADDDTRVKTVFWTLADVTAGEVLFGAGNPCAGREPQRFAFA